MWVLKRIPLQCLPVPNANSVGANSLKKMNNPVGIASHGSNANQPPVLSYADGQVAGKRIQPPAVIVSPTAPWSRADKNFGSQLPKPVKTVVKGNEDAVMQEAGDPCLPKPVPKNDTEYRIQGA